MSGRVFSASRRNLFRGLSVHTDSALRPPWALAEASFIECCERCGRCVDACPDHLLVRGSGGYPEVDFERGGCTFCGDCVSACPAGALRRQAAEDASAWAHRARVNGHCLSRKGIVCRACGDACETQAIRFRLRAAGRSIPLVNEVECTGCGACRYACPVSAVSLTVPQEDQIPCPA